MENTINYGIDLGTTNSAIAKFIKGEVVVYNNPTDFGRNTLPSVVGFRKDKIFVGTQARTYTEKDPKSVVGTFKRKMGTSESFKIKAINESKTPIELSAIVLKELKTFLPPSESADAVVITIPASFDMVQSNATKEAGIQAGFKQVVLLQEPIAASLAYANMKKEKDLAEGQWLVYDLGGGTFDAALVKIKDGEMRVLDHEGDNFLGGADFDRLIVEKILIPRLNEKYSFKNLEDEMKSASGKLNAKYLALLLVAETAKITLSAKSSAEIEISGFSDDQEEAVDEEIVITRSEFNDLIREYADSSIEMVKRILTRNSLKSNDLQFVLMVGGSTYIPYVRQRVEEILQIPINCEIDPTTAVAVGAAYFAATKPKQLDQSVVKKNVKISIRAAYEKTSKEKEEIFSARVTGNVEGLSYRITREDGGFDTGLKKLTERINEDLPLVESAYNFFKLTVYDVGNNIVETDLDLIGINSGFGISGQPLPEDICLEIDDPDREGQTKLLLVFKKNTVLPTKRTITRILNKTIVKGSDDLVIRVNVLEGPEFALPEANKIVGLIEIKGRNLKRDVSKGSDIELSFGISESRDLTVSAYLNMADQDFKETFNPKERHTRVNLLKLEADALSEKLNNEISEATDKENFEVAGELNKLKREMETISTEVESLTEDDVTDKKFQLEDKKRKLAQAIGNATRDKRVMQARAMYFDQKQRCEELLTENGNDHEWKHFNDIVKNEQSFLTSGNGARIDEITDELNNIRISILWRTPSFLIAVFNNLTDQQPRMNDQLQAKSLIENGNFAIGNKNWERLGEIDHALINLLPRSVQQEITTKIGF